MDRQVKEEPIPSVRESPLRKVAEFWDCQGCPVMIELTRGDLVMGSDTGNPSEAPPHRVNINRIIGIGKYEVTIEQWNACVEAGECPRVNDDAGALDNEPVRNVSWEDAQKYVQWLTKRTDLPYRLPTEAEWEFAARAGVSTRYAWGNEMRLGKANCKGCGEPWNAEKPLKVGSFPDNFYGLHDVSGNIREWVGDCWHDSYAGAPADGSVWDEPECKFRVLRGGSWLDSADSVTLSARNKYPPDMRNPENGFRVVRGMEAPK